jgi:hypothetical protein
MRYMNDPGQQKLFDPFERMFSPLAYKTIQRGWQGLFRHAILELLPAEILGEEFHPEVGRPTKELYSMAGLLFIAEFQNWNTDQAAEAYMFNTDIWYALNLNPGPQSMSTRTIERYQKLFRENVLAGVIMEDVTSRLVDLLELNISEQRLDSTHVFSDMASFGRTRLMGVTIKRFLTQLKRHDAEAYGTLSEELRVRYQPSQNRLFADTAKGKENRQLLRQQVAEDMYTLVKRFIDEESINHRSSFKMLCTVFEQQCKITEEKIEIRKETGGSVIQNPSDPDATFDGHKGQGYQVQISETCAKGNEVQLITCAIPQTASDSDALAVEEVCKVLNESGRLPKRLLADTLYGGDENVLACSMNEVDLVSPVSGKPPSPGKLTIGDFTVDEATETVTACPAGHTPAESVYNPGTGKTRTIMPAECCNACNLRKECPVKRARHGYRIEHTAKQRRLDKRRREEETEEFRTVYSKRAGIESTNSGIKRRTGMSRVRVRGKASVYNAILLRAAGWNIFQAVRAEKARDYVRAHMPGSAAELITAACAAFSRGFSAQIRQKCIFLSKREIIFDWLALGSLRCPA